MKEIIKNIIGFILMIHIPLGAFTWAAVGWEIHNFIMFWMVAILPISVPVGIYMFYFGPPDWIMYLFG